MIKLIAGNKVPKNPKKDWVLHPEVEIGINKIGKWMEKKLLNKEDVTVFSFNPIVFRTGLLLKLKGEKVMFYYLQSNNKLEEVMVDDLGYYVNAPAHFLDEMESLQNEISDIRQIRKGGTWGTKS